MPEDPGLLRLQRSRNLRTLGLALLASADDDELEDDVLLALLLFRQARRIQAQTVLCGRWGPRGPYDRVKVHENFRQLVMNPNGFTDRYFKTWIRYAIFV